MIKPAIKNEFYFPSVSGLADIHAASYKPDGKEIRAVLQIAHGMAEHLERYEPFIDVLCDNGIAVYVNDHLGHGKSVKNDDELGYFGEKDGWKNFVDDCYRLTRMAKEENPGKPVIFFGHSMGSFVARAYCIKYANDIAGAIYCGTAGPNPIAGVGSTLASVIGKIKGDHYRSTFIDKVAFGAYNNKFEKRTPFDWLSRDQFQVDKYIADKYCGFLFTAYGYRDLTALLGYISGKSWFENLDKKLPVLMIAGAMDPVGEFGKGIDAVYDKLTAAGKKNLKKILYPGGRHEILNESELFDKVCEDVIAWVNEVI